MPTFAEVDDAYKRGLAQNQDYVNSTLDRLDEMEKIQSGLRAENEKLKLACQLADQIMSQQITARTAAEEERDALRSRVERLEGALRELVRLKDIKEVSEITISEQDRGALLYLYEQAKPKAWAEARAALAQQDEQEG